MDDATKDRVQHEIEGEANQRFPGEIQSAVVLQYGDDPVVEPGELIIQLFIKPEAPDGQARELRTFHRERDAEIQQLRGDLARRYPEARRLHFIRDDGSGDRRVIFMPIEPAPGKAGTTPGSDLTPVMARLGPTELEIVDTLISAGIAANRAEAVRWALARISERPAYAKLRERTREIERLKAEF
jgi:hypothetical protein